MHATHIPDLSDTLLRFCLQSPHTNNLQGEDKLM